MHQIEINKDGFKLTETKQRVINRLKMICIAKTSSKQKV